MRKTAYIWTLVVLVASMGFAQAQGPSNQTTDSTATAASVEIQQLREALAAQQKQIAEQQARIDALAMQVRSQQAQTSAATVTGQPSLSAVAQVTEQKKPENPPPPSDAIVLKGGKIKIGAVAFADWSYYNQTGFGPAFLDTPNVYPGPGNDGYNSFDVTRTYINFLFSPTDWVTFRITPDIYRDIGSPAAQKLSSTSGISSTPNGSLNLRLKYGYAEFPKLFSGAFKDDNIRVGQQTNPLIDWQEGLYGYRFTSLVPWNFISLSSTYTGASLNGPIKWGGKQYLDYQIGVFNNSNFHAFELAETKTGMARLSFYPMGATSKYQGLGFTGFIDYGYNNAAPEGNSETPVVRAAALAHYQSKHDGGQIAFEYDFGRNAFSTGNLFGGSAPLDLVGLGTTRFAGMSSLASAVLAGRNTRQQGYDVFGHINVPNTKFAFFGLYQYFQPNTKIPLNPLDFQRVVAGISYRVNKNVRFAFDTQDVLYKHSQFTYPASSLATFSPTLAAANPGGIANAVPPSVKALFLNMEFTF